EKHGTDFSWKSEKKPVDIEDYVACPACGTQNPKSQSFCGNCGKALNSVDAAASEFEPTSPYSMGGGLGSMFSGGETTAERYESYSKSDAEIDGIPVGDWIKHIGTSSDYYLYFFKYQDRLGRKTAFTWTAAFFPVLYFSYRRVWSCAILSMLTSFLLNFPSALYALSATTGIEYFGLSAELLSNITYFTSFLSIGITMLWGVFAVYFFRKSAGKRLLRMREKAPTPEAYKQSLEKVAGPSKKAIIFLFGSYLVFNTVSLILLSL
ncbi:MAG: zinc ribbon domain-containing protein, partial [Oscillospiraceae bacterium]